jgi:hypothetical protein
MLTALVLLLRAGPMIPVFQDHDHRQDEICMTESRGAQSIRKSNCCGISATG